MVENLVFWSWFLLISVYFTAPCNGVEYNAESRCWVFASSYFKVWCWTTWPSYTGSKRFAWSGKPVLHYLPSENTNLLIIWYNWIANAVKYVESLTRTSCSEQGDAFSTHLTLSEVIFQVLLNICLEVSKSDFLNRLSSVSCGG